MKLVLKIFIALVIFFVVLGVGVVACTSSFFNSVDEEMKKDSAVTVPSDDKNNDQSEEEKVKNLKMGDTFKVGNVVFTVSKPKNEQPGEFDSPKSGNIIAFDITAKNEGKDEAFIDSGEFSLYDKDGNKIDTATFGDDLGIGDDVNSGKTLKGRIYYDGKKGQDLELIYSPNFSWEDVEVILKGKN